MKRFFALLLALSLFAAMPASAEGGLFGAASSLLGGFLGGGNTADPDATAEVRLASGKTVTVSAGFKQLMDEYESVMRSYADIMSRPDPGTLEMLSMLSRYNDMMTALDELDEDALTEAETAYYLEVQTRVTQMLLTVE